MVTMACEPRKKHRRPNSQEQTQRHNAHYCSNGEIPATNEVAPDAIFDQEIEDDYIKQARNQARWVIVEANGPI